MKREDSRVLELLREAVEAAAGGREALGVLNVLPRMSVGDGGAAEPAAPQSSALAANVVSGLAGLTGGGAGDQRAWTGWLGRVNPVAGLIAGLFAGKSEEEAAPVVVAYGRPEKGRREAGFGGMSDPAIAAVERQEGGRLRPAEVSGGQPQVVVQVQTLDSRSFLDHTPEIAEAVKRALLESNGLRDVLGEY